MTMAPSRPARPRLGGAGLSLAVLSAATFGTSGTFAASLIGAGWSPAAAVCARIAVAALILTVPALVQLRGRWAGLRRDAAGVAAYGLIAVAGCQLFYFNAVARMPVGVALLLEYLGAVLVVGWLWVRHGQRPRRLTVTGAATAVAGLVLVLDLTGSARINLAGLVWGLLAAVGLAIYFLLSAGLGSARSGGRRTAWQARHGRIGTGRRGAAADRHGLGRHVRGRGHPGGTRLDRAAAHDRHHPPGGLPRPPRQLARPRARAVTDRRRGLLRRRDRRRPPPRRQAGLIHRHVRGAVRDLVRLAAARPAAHRPPVPRRRVHPGRCRPGPARRAARAR